MVGPVLYGDTQNLLCIPSFAHRVYETDTIAREPVGVR